MKLEEYFSKEKVLLFNRLKSEHFSSVSDVSCLLKTCVDNIIKEAVANDDIKFLDQELISPLVKSGIANNYIPLYSGQQTFSRKEILRQIFELIKAIFHSYTRRRNNNITLSNETVENIVDYLHNFFSVIDVMIGINQTHIKMIEQEKIREVSQCSLIEKYKNVLMTYQRILGDTYRMEDTTISNGIRERIESDLLSMGFDIVGYDGNNDSLFDIRKTVSGKDEMVFPTIMQNGEIILKGLIFKN